MARAAGWRGVGAAGGRATGGARGGAAESDADGTPRFQPLYVKDRLGPDFDAEWNSSYRYILIVGQLSCDGGALLNVELVLHVKRLYEQRKQLHLLYDGRKALGEPSSLWHVGDLNLEAISRASRGLVLQLLCPRPPDPVDDTAKDALRELLQRSPCHLNALDLTGSRGFEGVELGAELLLPPSAPQKTAPQNAVPPAVPPTVQLACRRLRSIKLGALSLSGLIPPALASCVWLETLELHDNWLCGELPHALGELRMLQTLSLHGNQLSGLLPVETLCRLTKLGMLTLGGELGGNDELHTTRTAVVALERALPDYAEIYPPRRILEDLDRSEETAPASATASATASAAFATASAASGGPGHEGTPQRRPSSESVSRRDDDGAVLEKAERAEGAKAAATLPPSPPKPTRKAASSTDKGAAAAPSASSARAQPGVVKVATPSRVGGKTSLSPLKSASPRTGTGSPRSVQAPSKTSPAGLRKPSPRSTGGRTDHHAAPPASANAFGIKLKKSKVDV